MRVLCQASFFVSRKEPKNDCLVGISVFDVWLFAESAPFFSATHECKSEHTHSPTPMCISRYIDIDLHHGDAVEKAFYSSRRVMTVSFHKVSAAESSAPVMVVGKEGYWLEVCVWITSLKPLICTKMTSCWFLSDPMCICPTFVVRAAILSGNWCSFRLWVRCARNVTTDITHTSGQNLLCYKRYNCFAGLRRSWEVFFTQRGSKVCQYSKLRLINLCTNDGAFVSCLHASIGYGFGCACIYYGVWWAKPGNIPVTIFLHFRILCQGWFQPTWLAQPNCRSALQHRSCMLPTFRHGVHHDQFCKLFDQVVILIASKYCHCLPVECSNRYPNTIPPAITIRTSACNVRNEFLQLSQRAWPQLSLELTRDRSISMNSCSQLRLLAQRLKHTSRRRLEYFWLTPRNTYHNHLIKMSLSPHNFHCLPHIPGQIVMVAGADGLDRFVDHRSKQFGLRWHNLLILCTSVCISIVADL